MQRITCIPTHELIAVAALEGVYIHEYYTEGEPVRVFGEHKKEVKGVVHLSDDILASVDDDGMLLTWRAGTGAVLDQLKVCDSPCESITKASATQILVGTGQGEVILIARANGGIRTMNKRCILAITEIIYGYDISANDDVYAAVALSNMQIWNYSTGQRIHSIEHEDVRFCCGAVSDGLAVTGTMDCKIYVHQIRHQYNLLRTIDFRSFYQFRNADTWICAITFLNNDVVMVTSYEAIFFVSLESGQCISHCELDTENWLFQTTVLSDGRICVGGEGGYCSIFDPPQEAKEIISDYTQRIYSPYTTIVEEVVEEEIGSVSNENRGTVVVDATADSLANLPTGINGIHERIEGRSSKFAEDKIGKGDISELWEKMEMMQERNKDQERKIARFEQLNKQQEARISNLELLMKAKMETFEDIIAEMRKN